MSTSFTAWRYKDFRIYFGISFFFTFAYQMQATIIGFYVYQLTHSKMAIAFIGLSEVIPALGIALYGGYVADKIEKRKLLLLIYGGVLLTSMILFTITLNRLAVGQQLILPVIYAMLFCNGVARAFYEPATYAVYANSVPKAVFPNANSWNSLSWQSASIFGPAAGGLLYAYGGGISAAFEVIIVLLIVALILVYSLKKYPAAYKQTEDMGDSILAGIRFVLHNKIMLYTMSLDLFSVFFGGVSALLPVYALDILKVGAAGLGIMRTALSLGAALTMILLVRFPPMGKPWRNLLLAVGGFGCSIIAFGLSHMYLLSLFFLFAQGAFDSVSVVIRGTIMQLLTPEQMRGRVSAVNSMFIGSSSEIGDFESGVMAKVLGTVPAILFGGSMTLLIVIFTWIKTRRLLKFVLDDIH
jgi:MFS family permease